MLGQLLAADPGHRGPRVPCGQGHDAEFVSYRDKVKSVIRQRLKQSGMHWTTDGADAIIALRCREASSQWEAICNIPHTQTRTA
jgi:hypothetical protein